MSTKIYIVEDEPLIAQTIKTALINDGYTVSGIANNAVSALQDLSLEIPDLVLLDITIKGDLDGIALAEQIQQKFNIPYLFLTSLSDENTLSRIKKLKNYGFIGKPFNENGLKSNIELALFNFHSQNISKISLSNGSFFIKDKGSLTKIQLEDILFGEANDNYTRLYTTSKNFFLSYNLKKMLEKLDAPNFIRIHRSFFININHIESISNGFVLIHENKLPIGNSYKDDLMSMINLL